MELKQIVEVLKEHELYCYRIAFFLLGQEVSAILATKKALIELGANESFFRECKEERWKRAKKVTTMHSLTLAIIGH